MTEDAYQADHLAQGRRHTAQEHRLRYDLVVTPYRSQYLTGPAEQVTNITLQAKCRLDLTDHVFIIYDPAALHWVGHALLRDGPASPTFRPRSLDHGAACSPRALPALARVLAAAMPWPGGRWVVLGAWLWIGFHFLAR